LQQDGVYIKKGYQLTAHSSHTLEISNIIVQPTLIYNRNYIPSDKSIFNQIINTNINVWSSWHPLLVQFCQKYEFEKFARRYTTPETESLNRPMTYSIDSKSLDILPDILNFFNESRYCLLKPSRGTHCNDITLVSPAQLDKIKQIIRTSRRKEWVIQQFIEDAALLNGYRFDFRLFALFDWKNGPRVSLYNEGVCRYAAKPFTKGAKSINLETVLTGNTFRKKQGLPVFNHSLSQAISLLEKQGFDRLDFWQQAESCVESILDILTSVLKEHKVDASHLYFFTGLDVILRDTSKGFILELLEINELPQLLGWGEDVDIDLVPVFYRLGKSLKCLG
jgi:hypothetical protein